MRQQRPLLGILLMLAAMILVPVLDIFAKLLSADYSVIQVTWSRFVFHTLWLVLLLSLLRRRWWKLPNKPGQQFMRSMAITFTTLCFFMSIADNPIPAALALLFVSPLVVALIAPVWLGESFDLRRMLAVIVGFIGVLVVLQPSSSDFQPSLLWALVAGFGYAVYLMATRKLSNNNESSLLTLLHTAAGGLLVLTPLMLPYWKLPDLQGFAMMAAMGFFAAAGHFMIIKACEYASASQLSPFNYFEIVAATLLSYLLFDYWPDLTVWSGLLIISLSGLYITLREVRARDKQQLDVPGEPLG
ncbi:MAG: DMT family transporter [Gammaproteobacteria bacterium]|jgi:drug/metabolite transporter (DMT)-like permease|nr:DMT family transporter [Gammaproteobacteria bacterium]